MLDEKNSIIGLDYTVLPTVSLPATKGFRVHALVACKEFKNIKTQGLNKKVVIDTRGII